MHHVIDATDLSDDARDLLAQANDESALDPRMLARVRGALLAEVAITAAAAGVGANVARTALAAKTTVAPLSLSFGLGVKTLAIVALVSAAAAGGYGAGRHSMEPVATGATGAPMVASANAAAARPSAHREPEIPAVEPAPIEAPAPVVSAAAPVIAAAAPAASAPSTPSMPSPANVSSASPTRPTTPWAHDITNLRDAQAALVAGDPHEALRLVALVDPKGPFAGERTALSLVARCSQGATESTTKEANDFVLSHAGTPLAERVRAACH